MREKESALPLLSQMPSPISMQSCLANYGCYSKPCSTFTKMQDMALAIIQAQLASLVSQHVERTTMPNVPAVDTSYMQGYQNFQFVENGGWDDVSSWGYQGHNQSRTDLFSNSYDADWGNHSNFMWEEPQQEGHWQPYEEFYLEPMQPSQLPQQLAPTNSGTSLDDDKVLHLLTSLTQDLQNQTNSMGELKKQMGKMVEFMAKLQEQSERSSSTIEDSMGEFEFIEPITLESGMEAGAEQKTSKHSLQVDEELWFEEVEKATTSLEEALPQLPINSNPSAITTLVLPPPNSGKVVPNSSFSNPLQLNIPFPCRFLQSKIEEGKKDIFETFPMIQVNEVTGEYLELIQKGIFETTNPKEVGSDDTGQVTPNLVECTVPEFQTKEVVFVLEFMSEHTGS